MLRIPKEVVVVTGLFAMGLGACSPASTQSLPPEYLGRWYYIGSSGGITGGGMGDDPTGYIVITADNEIETFEEDGTRVGTRAFALGRGQTIFSSAEQWILDPAGPMPRMIMVVDGGAALTISENVYDGFQRSYVRAR